MATLTELRAKAKEFGIKGYYKMKKAELETRLKPKRIKVKRKIIKKKAKEGSKEVVQKLELEDLTKDETQLIAQQLKKAVKNMTFTQASQEVVKFVQDNLTDGGISASQLDGQRTLVRALALMKLNVFTLDKLIKIENAESYYYNATSMAEMAGDDDVYQYLDDEDEVVLTVPLDLDDLSGVNKEFAKEIEDADSYEAIYGIALQFLRDIAFEEKYDNDLKNIASNYVFGDPELEDIFSYNYKELREAFATYIALDIFGNEELTMYDDLDDDEDVDIEEARDKIIFSSLVERIKLDLGAGDLEITAVQLEDYDADEQEEIFGKVLAIKDDDGDYLGKMSDEGVRDIVNEINARGEWIDKLPNFANILSGLVYGYQSDADIYQDLADINEERYVDYYGFSFTRNEYIDGRRFTVASNNRLNDILRELEFDSDMIASANKLQEIAMLRLSQGEPVFA